MTTHFEDFINQIPKENYTGVKIVKSEKIVLFRPKCFITLKTFFEDYHFSLPSTTPPPIIIGKNEYQFKKDRMLIFNPGIDAMCTKNVPTHEYIDICIDKYFFQEIAKDVTEKKDIIFTQIENGYSQELMNIVNSFQYELDNFQDNCPLMIQSISIQMVVQLLREIRSNSVVKEKQDIGGDNYVKKAIEYMEAHYNANITIDDICNYIHVSPYHFIRMFKAKTSKTPHNYLLTIRLLKAKEILERGECSVGEVAILCGFTNQAHFSSVFKQIIGIPPSQYKKNISFLVK